MPLNFFVLILGNESSANSTAAVLYRSTHLRPTLLVDEADLFLSDDRQIVNFFNAGHRRGVPFRRCEGDENRVVAYDSWCPKALAQIGVPSWPQLLDRSLVVTLQRKRRGSTVERFRKGQDYPELQDLSRATVCGPASAAPVHQAICTPTNSAPASAAF